MKPPTYYVPTDRGIEARIASRLEEIRKKLEERDLNGKKSD
jgi:hypothetical protein